MILLVDKDPISADSIAYYLEAAGHRVETTFDAGEAVQRAAAAQPELIVIEVILSGRNGLSLAGDLKADSRTAHIPILVASTLDAEERARRVGAFAFLLKPVDRQELLLAVSAVTATGGVRS
jgi:CheY-like chemotaxis protein